MQRLKSELPSSGATLAVMQSAPRGDDTPKAHRLDQLPFVLPTRAGGGKGRDFWAPRPTGDYAFDCTLGERYAEALLPELRAVQPLLGWIVLAHDGSRRPGPRFGRDSRHVQRHQPGVAASPGGCHGEGRSVSRGHSRRSLFGIGDAGGATLLLAATEAGEAKAAELDAELLAACATFQREEAYHRQQYARVIADEISERDADLLIEKREEAYHDAADVICETPARTPEGLRAKAAAVVAFYSPDAPTGSIMDDSMWSVLCQVAGKPEEDVEKKGVAHDHPHASDRHTIQQWSDTR